MKKFMSMFLALCSLFCIFSATATTASAAEYSVPRTYVSIWRDGKYVDVVAWYEEDGSYYLEDHTCLEDVFPAETENTYFVPNGPAELGPYAKKYGYSMTLEGANKLILTKNGNSGNSGGNNGGEVTIPRTYLTVYKADKYVDITAWQEENGNVYLSGYQALQALFPDETAGVVFPTEVKPVSLKDYANQFGYTYQVKNKQLRITKSVVVDPDKRTDLTVYRDGKRVSATAWKIGDTVYVKSFKDLFKIFSEETKLHNVPNVKGEVVLSNYANQFGCSLSVNGNRLDVTTEKVNKNGIEIWINGEKLAIPENVPEPFVTNGTTLVPVRLVTEALGANVKWYQDKPHDLVTVTRDGVTLLIYVGTKDYVCNGKAGKAGTETVYKTINGNTSTMLPLRVISESFGASITWDSRTNRVIIMDEYLMK